MNRIRVKSGFSLTEVMMAAGILVIGFMLVAGTFPVGVKFTAMATEKTIAAIAADEAFAKVRIYAINPAMLSTTSLTPFDKDMLTNAVYNSLYFKFWEPGLSLSEINALIDGLLFSYPSADTSPEEKKYYWSALCRDINGSNVQVTVFVSRKAGANAQYPDPADLSNPFSYVDYPKPIAVMFTFASLGTGLISEIEINIADFGLAEYVNEESILVDASTGQIMTVLERVEVDAADTDRRKLILVRPVDENKLGDGSGSDSVFWVIPPATGSSRYPCIGVYQEILKF